MRVLADFVVSRWHVVAIAAAALVFSVFAGEGVQPPARSSSARFSIFPEGHNFNVFAEACSLFGFARSAEAVRVTFVWGLERPRETDPADDELRGIEESAGRALWRRRRVGSGQVRKSDHAGPGREPPCRRSTRRSTRSRGARAWMLSFCGDLRGSEATARRLKDPNSVVCFAEDVEDATRGVRRWVRVPDVGRAGCGAALRQYGRGESERGWRGAWGSLRTDPEPPPAPGRGGLDLTNFSADNWGSNEGRVASVAVTAVLRTSSVSSSDCGTRRGARVLGGLLLWRVTGRRACWLRGGFQTRPPGRSPRTETEPVDGVWTALHASLVFAFVVLLGASR